MRSIPLPNREEGKLGGNVAGYDAGKPKVEAGLRLGWTF
jgi:hypothetical protein